jgi:hypothetical protein
MRPHLSYLRLLYENLGHGDFFVMYLRVVCGLKLSPGKQGARLCSGILRRTQALIRYAQPLLRLKQQLPLGVEQNGERMADLRNW